MSNLSTAISTAVRAVSIGDFDVDFDGPSGDVSMSDDSRFVVRRRGSLEGAETVLTFSPASAMTSASTPASAPLPLPVTPPSPSPFPPTRRTGTGTELVDFGVLEPFVSDALVTDVFVNGAHDIWVDRGGGATRQESSLFDETSLRELATRLIALGGRHIDEATPCVDVRLHDGIRVHAVLPPISPKGTLLSIRLPRVERLGLSTLDAAGFFSIVPFATVTSLVARRENLLITGAGGSGKTTLLAALLSSAAMSDRIIAIEDVAELRVAHPHFLSLEARQANLEGAGQLGLERLVREALRMRPDRLVLGECRGAEIRELLSALNTGHDGGAGTLHANSLEDVPARIEALGALAGMSATAIGRQTVSAIGTVLHLERDRDTRRLAQIGHFELDRRDRLIMVVENPGGPHDSSDEGSPGRGAPGRDSPGRDPLGPIASGTDLRRHHSPGRHERHVT